MVENLLKDRWTEFDADELRFILKKRIGEPGQYHDRSKNPDRFHLPLAGPSCRIGLVFCDKKIVRIERGPAFDAAEWERISQEIETAMIDGPVKVAREYSFSSFRVTGYWRGERSGVQILPPPDEAPRAPVEMAQHPFILEFPIKPSDSWPIMNYRRMREHRRLTLLLNVLLAGRTSLEPRRSQHFWASVSREGSHSDIKWVQEFFFAPLGEVVRDELSPTSGSPLEELGPDAYYTSAGHDGRPLRVPSDLDDSICRYRQLSPANLGKFGRASFWMDMASRQWTLSFSACFASLVIAIETLTNRRSGGARARFRDFIETYARGVALERRRNEMYSLRSEILHGNGLMQMDQDADFGWDPPEQNEKDLLQELWGLTRIAVRNWLRNPSGECVNAIIAHHQEQKEDLSGIL